MSAREHVIIEANLKSMASPGRGMLDRIVDAARQGRKVEVQLAEGGEMVYEPQELAEYLGHPAARGRGRQDGGQA